jgi:polar amino acid transport system substrate-binding protein
MVMRRLKVAAGIVGSFCLVVYLSTLFSEARKLWMVTLDHPPHSFLQDEKVTGASTEVLQEILTQMGYVPFFQLLPWRRAQQMMEEGKADGIYSYSETPERKEVAYLSNPISLTSDVFYKRKNEVIHWEKLSDLRSYRIGACGGYNYPEEFLTAVRQGELAVEYVTGENSNLMNLRKLKMGRIDLLICNPDVCGFIILSHNPEFNSLDHTEKTVAPPRTFHVGFSKKLPDGKQIRDEFNRRFDEFLTDGRLKKIYDKYGMKPDYRLLGSPGRSAVN